MCLLTYDILDIFINDATLRNDFSTHRQLNSLFRIKKLNIKAPINVILWGKSTANRWIPLTKGQ